MSGAAITGYRKADSQVFVTFPTASSKGTKLTEERFREIKKETLQPTKGKKAHSFLKDGRLCKVTPRWRLESTIGKIVAFFEKIIHLIAKLWPFRPPEIDQRLFASLCSSNAVLEKGGVRAKLSSILDYTLRFMKQESKRSKVPKAFLRELSLAKDLAKEMEGIQRLTNEEVRMKKLTAFVAKVTKEIEVLKQGCSLTIPGGWVVGSNGAGALEEHGALYRFTRTEGSSLEFSLISRDPEVSNSTVLASAGKMKIYPETKFRGLQDKQLTDPVWLTSLLQLQLPANQHSMDLLALAFYGSDKANEPAFASSKQSIAGLLKRFESYQVAAPKEDPAAFVTGKSVGVPYHNVASLVDMACNPINRKGEVAQRRRLRFQLTSFCEFFWAAKKTLPENRTNRFLLREGMQNISRKASLLFERGQISKKELVFVNKQLASVETHLDQIDFPVDKTKKSPFLDCTRPRRHLFACHYDFLRSVPKRNKKVLSSKGERTKLSASLGGVSTVTTKARPFPKECPSIQKVSLKAIEGKVTAQTITAQHGAVQELMKRGSHSLAMDRIVAITKALVLPAKLEEITLSPSENERYSDELLALSESLQTCMQKRKVALPVHLYSLSKILFMQYQLARANESRSHFPKEFSDEFFLQYLFVFMQEAPYGKSSFSLMQKEKPLDFEDFSALLAVKKDMKEAHYKWYEKNAKASTKEKEKRTDFAKLQKQLGARGGKQIATLAKQRSMIETLFSWKPDPDARSSGYSSYSNSVEIPSGQSRAREKHLSSWVRPFVTVAMRAAATCVTVSEGEYGATEKVKKGEGEQQKKEGQSLRGIMTQESIVKDPAAILKRVQAKIKPRVHETTDLPPLEKEDLSDVLLLLTEKHSVQEFLGLVRNKPYLLESLDVRALIEQALFSGKTLLKQLAGEFSLSYEKSDKWRLSVTENRTLRKDLAPSFREEIKLLLSQGKVEPALFLIEVMQRMGQYVRGIPEYLESISADQLHHPELYGKRLQELQSLPWYELAKEFSCAPFFDTVASWAQDSLKPESPYRKHRRLLWRELLLSFSDREELSAKEIGLLVQGVAVIQNSSSTVFTSDMRREHAVRVLVEKWQEPLKKRVEQSPALRTHLCDLLCLQNQISVPKASWTGSFPLFQSENYEVDLLGGTVADRVNGTTTAGLPLKVIQAPAVRELFSREQLAEMHAYTYLEGGRDVHYCKDLHGNEVRVEQIAEGEVVVHKKLSVGKKQVWTQCISRDKFVPPEPRLEMTLEGMFQYARTLVQRKVRAPFPNWLKNPSYRFSIDPNNPADVFVSNAEGKPLFKLVMRRHMSGRASVLSSVVDLRENPQGPFAHFTIDGLGSKCHPAWRSLFGLEKSANMMVWRRKGQIIKVELPRYNLSFVKKVVSGKEQIVCTNPQAKGWILDWRTQSSLLKKGICRGLLLVSPSDSSKRRVLFPDFSNQLKMSSKSLGEGLFSVVEQMLHFFNKFVAQMRGLSYSPLPSDILAQMRSAFDFSSSKAGCFFIDVDPHTWEWQDHSKQPEDHFLYLSQFSTLEGKYRRALEFLQLAEKEKSGYWTKRQLELFKGFAAVPEQSPDVIALQLHAALLAKRRLAPSERFLLDTKVVELYKHYLGQGKKIDRCLRISRKDEYVCLHLLNSLHPSFVHQHLPLLVAQGKEELIAQPASYVERTFFPICPRPEKSLKELGSSIYKKLKNEAERIDRLQQKKKRNDKRAREARGLGRVYYSLQKRVLKDKNKLESSSLPTLLGLRKVALLEHGFLDLYNLVAFGDPKSTSHQQAQAILDSAAEKPGSFHHQLVGYLEAVIGVRKKGGVFPKAPSLTLCVKKPDNWDDMSWEKRQEVQKKEEMLHANNEKELEVFLEALDKALTQAPFGSLVEASSALPEMNRALWEKLDEQMKVLAKQRRGEVFAGGDPAVLVQKLRAMKPVPLPPVQPKPHGHALFSTKELERYFASVAQETLSAKEKEGLHPSLLREIAAAEKNRGAGFQLKGEKERASLEQTLAKAKQSAEKEAGVLKEKVLEIVYPKATDAYRLAVRAKMEKQVEWENILRAFLQRDLFSLEQELPGKVDMDALRKALRIYVIVASKEQRLGSALHMTQMMAEDRDGRGLDSGLELYKWLAAERQFDPAAYDHLLVFEFLSGFLLRADQMNLVNELANGRGRVKQAVTGAGKTSVILILTALMRGNGTNLVTLQFPKALYEENLAYVQRKLGKVFQRNLYPLRYSMRTPLAIEKQVAVKGTKETKVVAVSYFQGLYEDLVRTTIDKGVLVTTRGSLQALEQRWILLLHRLSNLPKGVSWSQVEKDHFHYLTKILQLLRERQESIIDEFDSELSPKEESHLTIGDGKPVAPFLWQSALDIFDFLMENDELGIRKNIQGEQSDEMRAQVLKQAAGRLADKWKEELNFDRGKVVAYLQGKKEIANDDLGWSPEVLDELAASKDLLQIFLPLTLSKSGRVKYMRSKDGMRVVPCLYTDVPREGARPGETLEDICYHIQDWYQQGISEPILRRWVQKLKNEAENECRTQEGQNLDNTNAAKLFQGVLKGHLLSQVQLDKLGGLCEEINRKPKLIRPFLEQALARIEVFTERVSCNGFNLVSMSKESGGASATLGSRRALHRKISVTGAGVEGVEGSMLVDLLKKNRTRKGEMPVLTYNAAEPERFVSTITGAGSGIESIVDGGSALRGCSVRNVALELAKNSGKGVIFFDEQGKKRVMYKDGQTVLEEVAGISPQEKAMALGQAHSRGADVRLGAKAKMCVTVRKGQTFQEILQSGGRSRRKTQQVRFATSTLSGITSLQELFNGGDDASTEQQKDSHFRAKKQEPVDIVRSEFLKGLFQQALKFVESGDSAELIAMYRKGDQYQLLVSRPEAHHDDVAAGAYFAKHGKLESVDRDPAKVLALLTQRYVKIATELDLPLKEFDKLPDYAALRAYLPTRVSSADSADGDREVEVDAEVEVEAEADKDPQEDLQDMTYFLNWSWRHQKESYAEHVLRDVKGSAALAAFDPSLKATENFAPIGRKRRKLPTMFHRSLHDTMQNRVHYLMIVPGSKYELEPERKKLQVKMVDNLDVTHEAYGISGAVYDMRAKRFCRISEDFSVKGAHKDYAPQIAQARFFDGQFRRASYRTEEWHALKAWLGEQEDLVVMETYLKETVLKYRWSEKQAYSGSDLDLLFRRLEKERERSKAAVG